MSEATPLLELDGVDISVGDDVICHGITLTINEGERHILLGPNGSGKSTLLSAIMGIKPFTITAGSMRLRGQDITDFSVEDRARAGIGLAYQRPPGLDGVTVDRLAHAIGADDRLAAAADRLGLAHLRDRDVNVGFSGGEVKRFEVLKLHLQDPSLCLFDEPESGVDMEQVGVVGEAVGTLLDAPDPRGGARAGLIITHTGFILDALGDATGHLMVDGRITASGDARGMFDDIRDHGYRRDTAGDRPTQEGN